MTLRRNVCVTKIGLMRYAYRILVGKPLDGKNLEDETETDLSQIGC
jgi:hypothetical protein